MKPFLVLVISFILFLALGAFVLPVDDHWIFAGNMAMSVMLIFTAIGHFMFPDAMAKMIPPSVPFRKAFIYASGLWEIMLAIGLLFPATRVVAGSTTIIFFIFILPLNVYSASRHINIEKACQPGPGPRYLWFRIPLQLFFITWVWFFSINQLACLYASHLTG